MDSYRAMHRAAPQSSKHTIFAYCIHMHVCVCVCRERGEVRERDSVEAEVRLKVS